MSRHFEPGSQEHVALWDAVNAVVTASGGSCATANVKRLKAVALVEQALDALIAKAVEKAERECGYLKVRLNSQVYRCEVAEREIGELKDRFDVSEGERIQEAERERDAARAELRRLTDAFDRIRDKHVQGDKAGDYEGIADAVDRIAAERDEAVEQLKDARDFLQGIATAAKGKECPEVTTGNTHAVVDEVLAALRKLKAERDAAIRDRNEFAAQEVTRFAKEWSLGRAKNTPRYSLCHDVETFGAARAAELRKAAPAAAEKPAAPLTDDEPIRVKVDRETMRELQGEDRAKVDAVRDAVWRFRGFGLHRMDEPPVIANLIRDYNLLLIAARKIAGIVGEPAATTAPKTTSAFPPDHRAPFDQLMAKLMNVEIDGAGAAVRTLAQAVEALAREVRR